MEERYIIALREYGLSNNEIEVYITSLKLGESSVQDISKNSNLPRTTVYHLLENLNKKGLVSYKIKNSIKYFSASEPERLKQILEEKKKYIEEVLPELKNLTKSITGKPNIEIYEGVKGIRSIFLDILEEKKEILHYGEILSLVSVLKYIFPQFMSERIKRKLPIRIIGKKEKEHEELIKNAKKEYRKFAFLPESFDFKSGVWIYKNKVAVMSLKEEPYYGIVIQDNNYNETQKQVFELLWKIAKK